MSGMWDHEEAGTFVETLFAKHHGEIYAYLLRMLREPELAADLTQDAFIKAYKNYETLEKPENARAWLYQIAHRVALDEIRRRKIIRFFPWTGESHGSAPSAERLVMDAHLSGDMQRALARIPERQRAALLLAELHDLTGVELAAALGVSHVAARALLTRARESLRQALAAERAAEAEAEANGDDLATRPRGTDEPPASPPSARGSGLPSTHDRARSLAATRVDWPLDPTEAAWLDAHLASCEAAAPWPPPTTRTVSRCAACATSSRSRLATCGLAPPPPSSANRRRAAARAGERTSPPALGPARRPVGDRGHRRRHRRQRPVGRVPHRTARATRKGGNPPIAVVPTPRAPGATPMAVGAGSVEWLGTSSTGGLAYNSTTIDEVCPTDRQPDCEPVNDRDLEAGRPLDPAEVHLAVAGQEPGRRRRDRCRRQRLGRRHGPSDAATDLDARPVADARGDRDPEPHPRADRRRRSPRDRPRRAPNRPSPLPSSRVRRRRSHRPPRSSHRSNRRPKPTPILTPEPTLSANLAIISGVKVVGQSAAYSPDGAWFAFTARPSDGSDRPGHLRLARR